MYGKFNAGLGRDAPGEGGAEHGLDQHVWRAPRGAAAGEPTDRAFGDADLAALRRVRVRARPGVEARRTARELPLDQVTSPLAPARVGDGGNQARSPR